MAKSNKAFDALATAVGANDVAAVKQALRKVKADAEPYNALGDSLLMIAIENGAPLPIIQALVEDGSASLSYKSSQKKTPISIALQTDRKDVIEYFASRGAKVKWVPFDKLPQVDKNRRLATLLEDWISPQKAAQLAEMLAGGADPNGEVDGKRPIFQLLERSAKNPATIAALLAAGADPNATNKQGDHALHVLADQASDLATTKLLLEQPKVSIDVKDKQGRTPLHRAACAGYWGAGTFIEALLKSGADPEARDKDGKRPVDLATGETKELLVKKTAKPVDKSTLALLKAIASDDAKAVAKLVASGADVSAVDTSGKEWGPNQLTGVAPVHLAVSRGTSRAVVDAVLAAKNIDVNVATTRGKRALHILLDKHDTPDRGEIVERLLALGADPNATDEWGQTPIYELRSFGKLTDQLELFDQLVAAGTTLALRDTSGYTVLDRAYDDIQYFTHMSDKAGFVRLVAHMLAKKAPTKKIPRKEIERWAAEKAKKYIKPVKPAAAAKATPPRVAARELFTSITGGALRKHVMKNAFVTLDGTKHPVALFDWFAFHDEQADDQHTYVDQMWEYHVPRHATAHVKAKRWIPFAVVGMTGAMDSYEEMRTHGTLFLDLTAAKGKDAPVIHTSSYDKRSAAAIAKAAKPTYTAVMKTLARR